MLFSNPADVIAATGTFGVVPRDAGVASATVTVGQQPGASIGTSLLRCGPLYRKDSQNPQAAGVMASEAGRALPG